jgi:hypothetical protein
MGEQDMYTYRNNKLIINTEHIISSLCCGIIILYCPVYLGMFAIRNLLCKCINKYRTTNCFTFPISGV